MPQDADGARIEFKNLAAEAVRQLHGDARVREQLDDLAGDDAFWAFLANSLAVFVTPDSLRTFRLPNRLVSLVEVSDRFHLKPLLRSVTFPQAALVLALAQNSVRVVEVAGDVPASELEVADLPRVERSSATRRPRAGSRAAGERRSGCASTPVRSTAH